MNALTEFKEFDLCSWVSLRNHAFKNKNGNNFYHFVEDSNSRKTNQCITFKPSCKDRSETDPNIFVEEKSFGNLISCKFLSTSLDFF